MHPRLGHRSGVDASTATTSIAQRMQPRLARRRSGCIHGSAQRCDVSIDATH